MKQIIPFKKEIIFNTIIDEITSISLEHNLDVTDVDNISGEFIISGQYKINSTSNDLEDFYYSIPFDIDIDRDYNMSNVKIDIDDFYYEIIKNNTLKVNIDVSIDGLEKKKIIENIDHLFKTPTILEEKERGKSDIMTLEKQNKENDIFIKEERDCIEHQAPNNKILTSDEIKEKVKSLFDTFDDSSETFATYHVYIVREKETLESILLKYNKTKDELAEYNNLDEIKIGTRLIIPATRYE